MALKPASTLCYVNTLYHVHFVVAIIISKRYRLILALAWTLDCPWTHCMYAVITVFTVYMQVYMY